MYPGTETHPAGVNITIIPFLFHCNHFFRLCSSCHAQTILYAGVGACPPSPTSGILLRVVCCKGCQPAEKYNKFCDHSLLCNPQERSRIKRHAYIQGHPIQTLQHVCDQRTFFLVGMLLYTGFPVYHCEVAHWLLFEANKSLAGVWVKLFDLLAIFAIHGTDPVLWIPITVFFARACFPLGCFLVFFLGVGGNHNVSTSSREPNPYPVLHIEWY